MLSFCDSALVGRHQIEVEGPWLRGHLLGALPDRADGQLVITTINRDLNCATLTYRALAHLASLTCLWLIIIGIALIVGNRKRAKSP